MNQEQTIALWQRCEDARAAALAAGKTEYQAHDAATAIWNRWASNLIARKAEMETSGAWAAEENWRGAPEGKNEDTSRWIDEAAADFSNLRFLTRALADAEETQVGEEAQEKPGSSSGDVKSLLLETTVARFDGWIFPGDARFRGAQFLSSEHEADFSQAHFERYTTFKDALFRAGAKFDAIRSDSTFDLAGASFEALPGFIQANFKEPPRFDHLTLTTPLARSEPKETLADAWRICVRQRRERRAGLARDGKAEAREETSKFRALKALAIKAHDGEREHLFHKGELRGHRLSDNEGRAVFLGNIAYDLLSDFGRSFLRPLAVWAGLTFGVAGIYWVSFLLTPARDSCGWLSAFGHSLYLATRSGLVLLGRARDQRLTDAYLCLFGPRTVSAGVPPDPPHPPAAPIRIAIPDIPGWVTFAEMAHTLISVILIFLIALALRNQFKIK